MGYWNGLLAAALKPVLETQVSSLSAGLELPKDDLSPF